MDRDDPALSPPARGWSLLILLLLAATGCASTRTTTSVAERTAERRLRRAVERWEGTPYCYGGTSRRCIDCSAFIQTLYARVFDRSLPRTTSQQVRKGHAVSKEDLQTGDLVFFHTTSYADHVGVYLSNGFFAHASTSEGVTVSHLGERYWQDHYWTARRLLGDFPSGPAVPTEPAPPAPVPVQADAAPHW